MKQARWSAVFVVLLDGVSGRALWGSSIAEEDENNPLPPGVGSSEVKGGRKEGKGTDWQDD